MDSLDTFFIENLKEYYVFTDKESQYLKKALIELHQNNPDCFKRLITSHQKHIPKENIFCDISDAIEYLKMLQKEGYYRILDVWENYETNYIAEIDEEENDQEYYSRIGKELNHIIYKMMDKKGEMKRIKSRIDKLKEELRKLEELDLKELY